MCAKLCELRPGIHIPVSLTIRQPRPGEIDGVGYHSVPEHRFREIAASGQLLEHTIIHDRYGHGTPRKDVADTVATERDVLLEIDIQGARQVKRNLPEVKLVLIAPPLQEELVKRLEGRGTEDALQMGRRLTTARVKLKTQEEADFVVMNDRIEDVAQVLMVLMGL